jgi:hypothetical protein
MTLQMLSLLAFQLLALTNVRVAIDSGMSSKVEALDKVLDDNESSEEDRHIVRGIGSVVRGKGSKVVVNAGAVAQPSPSTFLACAGNVGLSCILPKRQYFEFQK